ncbi:MAG: type IV pilus assembly protein PilM [Candidatus Pacebacteria bacterium]|jgi:type IV pilus assembly protein PilM|nr:type IV pilus assembly protein PilM [Candidatus Paceibacterota bacterium]
MAFNLQSITSSLKGIFSRSRSGGVIGIDIGSSSVKLVQVKQSEGKIVLETYGELALGPYGGKPVGSMPGLPPEKITEAIKDLMKQANVTASRGFFSLQSGGSLIFVLELPDMSETELAQVIPNEARKFIPVPLSEVALDWFVVPRKETYSEEEATKGERKKLEILVVAVRNEMLELYQSVTKTLGTENGGLEIEMFSIIRALFHHEITPVMLVDVGASGARIAIVEYGVIRTFHVVSRGGVFLTDTLSRSSGLAFDKAEELKREIGMTDMGEHREYSTQLRTAMQIIVSEMRTVLSQYERTNQKIVSKVMLVGGGSMLKGFREAVAEEFKVETVFGNPFLKTEAPEFLRPVLIDAGPVFTTAVGIALKELV